MTRKKKKNLRRKGKKRKSWRSQWKKFVNNEYWYIYCLVEEYVQCTCCCTNWPRIRLLPPFSRQKTTNKPKKKPKTNSPKVGQMFQEENKNGCVDSVYLFSFADIITIYFLLYVIRFLIKRVFSRILCTLSFANPRPMMIIN